MSVWARQPAKAMRRCPWPTRWATAWAIPDRLSARTTGQAKPSTSWLRITTGFPASRRAWRYQGSTALTTTRKPATCSHAGRSVKRGTTASVPGGQPRWPSPAPRGADRLSRSWGPPRSRSRVWIATTLVPDARVAVVTPAIRLLA